MFVKLFNGPLLLSSDIETQQEPKWYYYYFNDSFSSFCNWNKNDFQRVSLLEAHNSIFKYGIISCETILNEAHNSTFKYGIISCETILNEAHNSIFKYGIISCETILNEATKVPENTLTGYHFFSSNHPRGDKKGRVGIFYKESLPPKIRHDLSFED